MPKPRIGLWLIGAKGGVACTSIVGLCALRRGLIPPIGLTSALPQFSRLDFAGWDDFVVGGHEVRDVSLTDEAARDIAGFRMPCSLVGRCEPELRQIDARIRPGTLQNVGPAVESLATLSVPRGESPRETVERLGGDLREFAASEKLEHVVVVNLASTEPPVDAARWPTDWPALERMLGTSQGAEVPASTLYAIAAFEAGCSYINFTPSLGSAPPALDDLARLRGTRHMGCDGKTGETLLKSVLAPMFARRNLQVLSWVGHNIFGNMDGQVLSDPANKQAKIASKDHLIADILGYRPQTHVSIEYIQSLGDWKTAWDHVHFAGFLGTPMTLQFIWQGCDSILAAPLVLDLVRFTELARRRGETGLLWFLAGFFKSPYGVAEQRFDRQYALLEQWASEAVSP